MDCRLHFKNVFFVSASWYLQDKNTAFLRRNEGCGMRGGGGGGWGPEGFVSIRSNGLSFLNVFTERVQNQRTSAFQRKKKYKTNKSCENLWSKCWCWECKIDWWNFSHYASQMCRSFGLPLVHLHRVVCLVRVEAAVDYGPLANTPMCSIAVIRLCLFLCTITGPGFKAYGDPQIPLFL